VCCYRVPRPTPRDAVVFSRRIEVCSKDWRETIQIFLGQEATCSCNGGFDWLAVSKVLPKQRVRRIPSSVSKLVCSPRSITIVCRTFEKQKTTNNSSRGFLSRRCILLWIICAAVNVPGTQAPQAPQALGRFVAIDLLFLKVFIQTACLSQHSSASLYPVCVQGKFYRSGPPQ